jgi:uncharacterized protein (DUF427 family)
MPRAIPPAEGQESVWDYPRPPRLEAVGERVRIVFNGEEIVSTDRALRILETSHPPTIYVPPEDVAPGSLEPAAGRSYCEWKGMADYLDVVIGDRRAERAAWTYPDPSPPYDTLRGYVAFYPAPMDACFIGAERVTPQPGGFYGGWITPRVVGPFKGEPGTLGW